MKVHVKTVSFAGFLLAVGVSCTNPGIDSSSGNSSSTLIHSSREDAIRDFVAREVSDHGVFPNERVEYSFAFKDLNDDGVEDAIIHLMSRSFCGSGGCKTYILEGENGSYSLVSWISISRPPIRVFESSSNGWRDISVRVGGGGIGHSYEAVLQFDGEGYPRNPSVAPARRLRSIHQSDILISPSSPVVSLR